MCWRIRLLWYKLRDLVLLSPLRVRRCMSNLKSFLKRPSWFGLVLIWFSILDIFGLGDIFEFLQNGCKPIRRIRATEMAMAYPVFGDSIDYKRICIDEKALIGPKQKRFAYVFCHTINSYGTLSAALFIHELVHIWQYKHYGLQYIPLAWSAQKSVEGYNYGGLTKLKQVLANGDGLSVFNLEQQADIVADYFRLLHDERPCWGSASAQDIFYYEQFIKELGS